MILEFVVILLMGVMKMVKFFVFENGGSSCRVQFFCQMCMVNCGNFLLLFIVNVLVQFIDIFFGFNYFIDVISVFFKEIVCYFIFLKEVDVKIFNNEDKFFDNICCVFDILFLVDLFLLFNDMYNNYIFVLVFMSVQNSSSGVLFYVFVFMIFFIIGFFNFVSEVCCWIFKEINFKV